MNIGIATFFDSPSLDDRHSFDRLRVTLGDNFPGPSIVVNGPLIKKTRKRKFKFGCARKQDRIALLAHRPKGSKPCRFGWDTCDLGLFKRYCSRTRVIAAGAAELGGGGSERHFFGESSSFCRLHLSTSLTPFTDFASSLGPNVTFN